MSRLRKFMIGLGALLVLLLLLGLVAIRSTGAWNLLFPGHDYETVPPEIAADFGKDADLRVLVFSKTNSFRHKEGIDGARQLFETISTKRNWAIDYSENSALFDAAHLARFDVVVFSNASGDTLSDAQDKAFQAWLEGGGGWVGIHAAGDSSHQEWTWYQDTLIGGLFTAHIMGPQTQEARVVVEDRKHPVTRDLPADFVHEEEWYSWDASARAKGFHVLLTVDESTYDPFVRFFGQEVDLRMGDHPIVWSKCVGAGVALYSAMGHWAEAYSNPHYAKLLENGIAWVGDDVDPPCVARTH